MWHNVSMRIPWLVALALITGCELAEGGGLAEAPEAGGSDAASEVGSQDASVDTSFPDAVADSNDDVATNLDAGSDAPADAPVDAPAEAGPVLTITGGTYTLRGPDAGVCSANGAATNFQLVNSRDASVDLVWVNYGCVEAPYGVIAPLGTQNQPTFVNHVWRVRNDADKKFLAEFVLQSGAASYTVTVH